MEKLFSRVIVWLAKGVVYGLGGTVVLVHYVFMVCYEIVRRAEAKKRRERGAGR